MTKEEIIKFIDRNYADGEHLVWQTVSQGDIGADDDDWEYFINVIDDSSTLADIISEAVADTFYEVIRDREVDDE